jgi:dihydrofolate reductase
MIWFAVRLNESAPTSWAGVCLIKVRSRGQNRRRFTRRYTSLRNEKREPWVRPGGTTFFFINEGPEHALELARESASTRDVRIAGGADVIQQYLNLGVVDELEIALAPVLFGGGRRLFDNIREPTPQFRIARVLDGSAATRVRYVRQ